MKGGRLELLARCITYEIHKHRDTCFVEGLCFGRTGEIVTLLVVCRSSRKDSCNNRFYFVDDHHDSLLQLILSTFLPQYN